jgi:hypothetical protein
MPDVDGHGVDVPDGRHRSERKAFEGIGDLMNGLLERRPPVGTGHFPTPSGSLGLGVLGRFVAVGVAQERYEATDKEPEFGITAEERLAETITLRWAAPSGGCPRLFFEDARFKEALKVSTHRGRMDSEETGELGNLTRPFFEGLHDLQPADVTE